MQPDGKNTIPTVILLLRLTPTATKRQRKHGMHNLIFSSGHNARLHSQYGHTICSCDIYMHGYVVLSGRDHNKSTKHSKRYRKHTRCFQRHKTMGFIIMCRRHAIARQTFRSSWITDSLHASQQNNKNTRRHKMNVAVCLAKADCKNQIKTKQELTEICQHHCRRCA